jgi:hypothetical protein
MIMAAVALQVSPKFFALGMFFGKNTIQCLPSDMKRVVIGRSKETRNEPTSLKRQNVMMLLDHAGLQISMQKCPLLPHSWTVRHDSDSPVQAHAMKVI